MKEAIDNTKINVCGCIPVKLYLEKQTEEGICPTGCRLLTPALQEIHNFGFAD